MCLNVLIFLFLFSASKREAIEEGGLSEIYAESFFLQLSIITTMSVLVLVIMVLALVVFRMAPRSSSTTYKKRADEMPIIN